MCITQGELLTCSPCNNTSFLRALCIYTTISNASRERILAREPVDNFLIFVAILGEIGTT